MRNRWPEAGRPLGTVPFGMLLGLGGMIFLLGESGPNAGLALVSVLAFVFGTSLLWRPGETPILLFVYVYQWLQVSLPIFHANWLGERLLDYSALHGNLEQAASLSLLGLLVLTMGMRLGAGRSLVTAVSLARRQAQYLNVRKLFHAYLVMFIMASLARLAAAYAGGLAQLLLAIAAIKWSILFVLIYVSFVQKGVGRQYAFMAFAIEFVVSLGGFFSDFKTVFVFSFLAVFAAGVRISLRQAMTLSLLASLVMFLAVIWSAIKVDYRNYLSGGTGQQVITVGYRERMAKLAELVGELDGEDLARGGDRLIRRTSYIEYFGRVLDFVPAVVPYAGGEIWWDALRRPFMPRLFFPDKAVINDSERTAYYTGERFTRGTSVSIGYMGEAYIDFGAYGMMVLLLMYGYGIGRIYRWLLNSKNTRGLLGLGIASSVLYVTAAFESSATKVLGGVAVSLLVTWMFARWVIPKYLPWLRPSALR